MDRWTLCEVSGVVQKLGLEVYGYMRMIILRVNAAAASVLGIHDG